MLKRCETVMTGFAANQTCERASFGHTTCLKTPSSLMVKQSVRVGGIELAEQQFSNNVRLQD